MPIPASQIIAEVARRLNDTNNARRRWPDTELLKCVNKGQKLVAEAKPESCVVSESVQLSAGFAQSLPAGAKGLKKIDYNAGTNGTTPGKTITRIPVPQLDEVDPGWRSTAQAAEVDHYTYDAETPKEFGVYPPNDGTQYIHMVYTAVPADCASESANIVLADEYEEALTQATIWYALSDRTEDASMRVIRSEALQYLQLAVGVKNMNEEAPE